MTMQLPEEHQMIKDLVARFVRDELLPLEPRVIERDIRGLGTELLPEETARLDAVSREMGLWGLNAPREFGGHDLPAVSLVAVVEEMARSVIAYPLPPDSPNLRMLAATAKGAQRDRYLAPYSRGEITTAIAISEPGAGGDPAGMTTRAVRDGEDWIVNGRKIWISMAAEADVTILMAVTDKEKGARGGMSAFLVDKGTAGFNILRKIPIIGGVFTYEIAIEDMRLPGDALLGVEGEGFAPMQLRLGARRLELCAMSIGLAQRALDMAIEYAPQRKTFGAPLSERQAIQFWIAEAATKIHASRLMMYDCAAKIDAGQDVRVETSMVKAYSTEMAWSVIDHAMQTFGAMGLTKELPLQLMAARARIMRIVDGPTEIHKWVVARNLLNTRK